MAKRKRYDLSLFRYRQVAAMAAGAWSTSPKAQFWDIAGKCSNPRVRTLEGGRESDPEAGSVWLDINVPCRKCPECLSFRSWFWRTRAKAEILKSSRSWMATYTVRPNNRVWFEMKASRKFKEDVRGLDPHRRFAAIAAEIGKEYTKYLKRVRKQSKAKMRYLLVFESHKDGWPHLHALIHEQGVPITKACLEAQWPHGFTKIKLCDMRASWYVTKYLAKSMDARVRASIGYGDTSLDIVAEPESATLTTRPLKRAVF